MRNDYAIEGDEELGPLDAADVKQWNESNNVTHST